MSTRLQRHVHSRASRILIPLPAIRQSCPLSVQPPQLSMKPLANYLPATHNNSSNQRIRANTPTPPLSKRQSSLQMLLIRGS